MPRRRDPNEPTLASLYGELRADFAAAKASRFRRKRNVPPGGAHADYHYRSEGDYLRIMETARDMDRNDVIVSQTIDRAVGNILQDGLAYDPQTGDAGVNQLFKDRWLEWCDDPEQCDLAGERTFWEMEDLVLRESLVDGDILVLPTVELSLELVEGHRLRTPTNTTKNVVHGVLLDGNRRRQQYWLTREDVAPMHPLRRVNEVKQYPARDEDGHKQVFHIYTGRRASQTRGISALAPIFDVLGMFEDLNFAKLVQQQVVSCFAIFREMDAQSPQPAGDRKQGAREEKPRDDGSTQVIESIAPGMQIRGSAGEKLRMDSPSVPNPEFFDHVRLILTLVGINLGLPLVMVLMDGSETNFSGWRGAIDQAKIGFRRMQRRLRQRFHSNVANWLVRNWIAEDAALRKTAERSDVHVYKHRFRSPAWPYIEPLKDRSAELLSVRNALTSQRRRCQERGVEWDELTGEIVEDNAALITKAWEMAEQLNKQHVGLDVNWREVAMLPTPDGLNITFQSGMSDDGQPGDGKRKPQPNQQPQPQPKREQKQ